MTIQKVDVLLVGGGVMSATLGTLLTKLDPSLKLTLVERLDHVAHESTDGWNNAGTGHAGYCELNYTPSSDGNVSIERALTINANFEISLQLWSHLVESGSLPEPTQFINTTPHISFVWGEENVSFLRQRAEKLKAHHLFAEMEYSEDPEILKQWMPLVMEGRAPNEKVAGTRIAHGTDVDFGSLTRNLVNNLEQSENFNLKLNHEVVDFQRHHEEKRWTVTLRDRVSGETTQIDAGFVFLGAGGGSLPLLQASGIDEADGYGGFPVSGQWLVCKDKDIVSKHHAKVYGKAAIGAPPMSVPHLDTRIINGTPALLFGPYAGFTTKFLKSGSKLDMFKSISPNNLYPMLSVGMTSMDLTKYLISEVMQSHDERVETLRGYFPEAKSSDWTLAHAGQRVQVIKKDAEGKGTLEFGTELVSAADGSLAALLGASPGASVAVFAMIEVLEKCFADKMSGEWRSKMKEIIPSYGESLVNDAELLKSIREYTLKTLNLT